MVMISLARPAAPFKTGTLTGPSATFVSKVQAVLRVSRIASVSIRLLCEAIDCATSSQLGKTTCGICDVSLWGMVLGGGESAYSAVYRPGRTLYSQAAIVHNYTSVLG